MAYGVILGQTPIIPDQSQIGDVKITTRTDLGDQWMLCDGGVVQSGSYPQLVQSLQPDIGEVYTEYAAAQYNPAAAYDSTSGNWFVVYAGDSGSGVYIQYASSLTGSWSTNQIYNYSVTGIRKVKKINNLWFIITSKALLYTSNILGTWTAVTNGNIGYSNYNFKDIVYFNNKYVIASNYYSGAASYLLTNTQISTSGWTPIQLSQYGLPNQQIDCLIIYNNNLVLSFGGSSLYSSQGTNLSTNWTENQLNLNGGSFDRAYYLNGSFELVSTTIAGNAGVTIYSNSSLSGQWTQSTLFQNYNIQTTMTSLIYTNNTINNDYNWICITNGYSSLYIANSSSVSSSWQETIVDVPSNYSINYPASNIGTNSNGEWIIGTVVHNDLYTYYGGTYHLPNISLDKVNAYIKVT